MAYPKEIFLSPEQENKLRAYLRDELINHDAERSSWVDDVKLWDQLYWAKPESEASSGPLKGGSTLIIPLIATTVESLHARNMTGLFALEQFLTLKLPPVWSDIDHDLERLLDHEIVNVADIYSMVNSASLENTKFGTAVGKSGYKRETKWAVRYIGDERSEFEVPIKQNVCIDGVQLTNFLMPFRCNDPQTADWCGEEHEATPFQIKQMVDSGLFREDTMEKLTGWLNNTPTGSPSQDFTDSQRAQENRQIVWPKTIRWKEIWLGWDTVGDNRTREIIVHYHVDSDTFLSVRYNWYNDLHRQYRYVNHFPIPYRWPGIGVCKMLDQFQIEVTTQHRQKIDNGTIVNMRMIKIRKLAGYGPNEPIYAGKIWLVDDKDDIEAFQLGELYPSGYQNEQLAVIYSQQRSGVNELTLGMPASGTPGTAAGDLSRVQEGNKRHDYTFKALKRFVTEVSKDAICNVMQFGVKNIEIYNYLTNGEKVKAFLNEQNIPLVRDGVALEVDLAGQNENNIIDRASWTQITGMLTQYYGNILTLIQQLGDPNLALMVAIKAIMAGGESMQQVLESFDLRNINKLIITPSDITRFSPQIGQFIQLMNQDPMMLQMMQQQQMSMQNGNPQQITAGQSINSGSPGLIQSPGMGLVNPINTTVGGNY